MLAIADVAIVVSDAKASARWWKEKVGFATHTIGTGHAVLVAPPGDRLVLHLCEGFAPVEPGNSGIAFLTDEIEATVDRMRRAGVTFPESLTQQPWGLGAKFADPDGNVFWLLGVPSSMVRATLNLRAPGAPNRRARSRSPRRRGARRARAGPRRRAPPVRRRR